MERMWRLTARRCLSSAAVAPKSTPPKTFDFSSVPTRHSRKHFPRVCLDAIEREDLTQQLLESNSLFSYKTDKNERSDAWAVADAAVQMAEYVVRGYAASVPGTNLFRFLPNKADGCDDPISPIVNIMDKLWDEGRTYMSLRDARIRELASREGLATKEPDTDTDEPALSFLDKEKKEAPSQQSENDAALQIHRNTTSDFALPGITVTMYNQLFDAMACSQPDADIAYAFFDVAASRHQLDGGDTANTNPHTQLQAMTYNAAIRIAANSNDRDAAMVLAFTVFDSLPELTRNSSTYENIIRVIGKHVPVCRSRGNMAFGMLEHARRHGVWSTDVLDAYLQANSPSNGPEFDAYIERYIRDQKLEDIPQKFRRNASVKRHHRKDAVY